MVFVLRNEHRL